MELEKQLHNLGFEDKEIKVYLACLQLGEDTAFNIAKKSGLKRPTTYFVLNILSEKGLISIKKTKKVTLYSPANPKKIMTDFKRRESILENVLPSLQALYNAKPEKPNIQIFEGEEGMKELYSEMIEYLKKGKEVILYGAIEHLDQFPELTSLWLHEVGNKKHKTKELLNLSELDREYIKKAKKNKNPNHKIKILPKGLSFVGNDNVIMGNKLVIFSTHKKVFATVIESKDIANSYRALFELGWKEAKKV